MPGYLEPVETQTARRDPVGGILRYASLRGCNGCGA